MKRIHFLVTSDTHAQWIECPDEPSLSLRNTATAMRTLQEKAKSQNEPVITIDLGDFIQGSAFATYLNEEVKNGQVLARAMNDLNYDYQLIGNHEFNYGPNYRDDILNQLNASILCANIVDTNTQLAFFGEPYDIFEIDNITVGIIGITTHYIPNWELPAHYQGLKFLDAYEIAAYYTEMLRPQVDLLIVAYHGGYEADLLTGKPLEELTGENQGARMLKEIDGIDLLLTGHQHRIIEQHVGQTYTIQPGYAGERVAHILVEFSSNGELSNINGQLIDVAEFASDVQIERVMSPELQLGIDWLQTPLGFAPLTMPTKDVFDARVNGHPFVEFINEIQKRVTGADFSAAAIINDGFQYFTGLITNETLLKAYPFYNLIAKVELSGQELYEVLNFDYQYFILNESGNLEVNPEYIYPKPKHYNLDLYSGITVVVDMDQPHNQRVVDIIDERTGKSINKEATYTIALTQYRAVGGGDYTWFGRDKIIYMTDDDIASLMKQALTSFKESDWNKINENYSHVKWLGNHSLSDNP